VLGDILVTQFDVDLRVLFFISAGTVTAGMIWGYFFINPVSKLQTTVESMNSKIESPVRKISILSEANTYILEIRKTFESPFIVWITAWWVVGNAVWMTLYDYEV
jgi:hypothetical protein